VDERGREGFWKKYVFERFELTYNLSSQAKWQMWGNEAIVKIYNGAPHGFIMLPPGTIKGGDEVLADSVEFVKSKIPA
jgi:hypothetical protein